MICTQTLDVNDPILGFFHRWVEEFAKHFERIDVICLKEGIHSLPAHVHVHSLGKEGGESYAKYLARFYTYFWQAYMDRHADFVFFHMGAIYNILAAPFSLIRRFKKTKFYWWKTHGHINLMGRIALLFVDRVYTAVAESFPVRSRKRHVVGHAIDTDLFNYTINYKINYTILFTGRISRTKHVEQVIEIVRRLRDEDVLVTARIVGQVLDRAYYDELQKQVQEHDLTESVTFVPGISQSELVTEYQQAAIFINPSETDGLDKVVLEAMACGSVPLTANRSFDAMLSPHGLYMERGDIAGYAARAKEILEMDEDTRAELTKELRTVVGREHALTTLPKRIFNIG